MTLGGMSFGKDQGHTGSSTILEKIKNTLEGRMLRASRDIASRLRATRVELAYSDKAQVKNDFKSILVYTPTEFQKVR